MSTDKEPYTFTRWFVSRPRLSGLLTAITLLSIVTYIAMQRYQIIRQNDDREMNNLLAAVHRNITQSLQNSYTSALSTALIINDDGVPENFDEVAGRIMGSRTRIDALQLLPNGVVQYVYPKESNNQAIGLNILQEPDLREDALCAIRDNKFYFAGPLRLRQGGIGVVGRLPVYQKGKFWGFSAVIIRLETLINASGIKNIDQSKYYFQFSRTNPVTGEEEFYFPERQDFSKKQYLSQGFPDSSWRLYIINRQKNAAFWQVLPMGILGLLLATMFGFIIHYLLRQPAELQKIVALQAQKLAGSERRYKTIFDQAAVGIVYVDSSTGHVLEANHQFATMLETTPDDIVGCTFRKYTHPEDIPRNEKLLEELFSGRIGSFQLEKRYITKAGKLIWAHVTVVPLQYPGSDAPTHLAVVEDITLTKIAQEKIKESEARFKRLFEDLPVALWEEDFSEVKKYLDQFDNNQSDEALEAFFHSNPGIVNECVQRVRVVDVNNKCLQYHSPKSKDELLKGLAAILDGYSHDVFIRQLVAIMKGRTQLWGESAMSDVNGKIREFALRWSVIRGYEDTYERVIIYGEDVTIQKETERIRMDAQQKIENIVNTIDGIVWEWDAKANILNFISRKTEAILGYSVDEWYAATDFWSDHIHPDDKSDAISTFERIKARGVESEFEYRMISKFGDLVWIRDIVTVQEENGRQVLRGIMIDVTRHKEADADLNNTLDLVNEQKKRLMNFSYIVSHNLRSHNANIQSIINLVQDSDSEEERDELIGHLKTVSDSLDETMQHLGALVNIQTNITLVTEPLRINHYVDNTRKILSEMIASRQVSIINNIPDNAVIHYNAAYLESIVLNLISNAIRYSHPDRKPFIKLDWSDAGNFHVMKVTDNGLGIDIKRFGDKMFGMYKTFHGNPEARGVGLFMTRSQIEAMGGRIEVESEPGKGSTFSVFFPKPKSGVMNLKPDIVA